MTAQRDILVVGAGIIGCSVAYELARRGASVEVVDARPPAMGATQAAAGMLAPYHEAGEHSTFLDISIRSLNLFDDFVRAVTDVSGMPVEYRRTGTLEVALDDDQIARLRNTAARLDAQGVAFGLLDAQSARAEEPQLTADAAGALLVPTHGFVAAADLTRATAAAARHHGAQIVEGVHVRRIAADGDDVVVDTDRGRLTTNTVVLAAGAWTGRIEVAGVSGQMPVRPVRGQLLQLGWPGPQLRRIIWGPRCYLVPWQDGTVLVGATMEEAGFDERATAAGVRDLLDAACELLPPAWTAGFIAARAGLRPASGDALPIVGPSGVLPNLIYATGHFRNGILLAPLTARLVADVLVDGKHDPVLEKLRPQRFGEF